MAEELSRPRGFGGRHLKSMPIYSIEELRFQDPDHLWQIYYPDADLLCLREFDGYMAAGQVDIAHDGNGTIVSAVVHPVAMEMIAHAFDKLADRGVAASWTLQFEADKSCIVTHRGTGRTWQFAATTHGYDVSALPWQWVSLDDPDLPSTPVVEMWDAEAPRPSGRSQRHLFDPDQPTGQSAEHDTRRPGPQIS